MISTNRNRWFVLFVFMVAHGINDGFGWIIPPLLPAIREYYQLSYTEMGAFYTVYRIVGNIFQTPAAYLVHLMPISVILVTGLLLSSVGMFVASLSPSYSGLVCISAAGGIGRSAYHPIAVTMLSRLFGRDTFGRAMGLHLSGSSIGMVLAPFIVGILITRYSWRIPLQLWSLLGVAAGVILFFFLRNLKSELQPKEKPLRWPFFSGPLCAYLLAVVVWGIAQSGLMAFLPLFLVDHRHFNTVTAAATFGLMSFSGAVCRPFLGGLMDKMRRRKPVIIGGFIISSVTILVLVTIENHGFLYGALILLGIFGTGHGGLADTLMIEMIPSQRREETIGFIYTLRMGIASLSPLAVGFASERFSLYHSYFILAFAGGLAAFLLLLVKEKPAD